MKRFMNSFAMNKLVRHKLRFVLHVYDQQASRNRRKSYIRHTRECTHTQTRNKMIARLPHSRLVFATKKTRSSSLLLKPVCSLPSDVERLFAITRLEYYSVRPLSKSLRDTVMIPVFCTDSERTVKTFRQQTYR